MTIKIPNYSVSGSPTIDSNFIASGFSSSNYISMPEKINSLTDYDIYAKITVNNSAALVYNLLSSYNPTTPNSSLQVQLVCWTSPYKIAAVVTNQQSGSIMYTIDGLSVSVGSSYWIKLHVTNSTTGTACLYAIEDNGYTKDTLPTTGWETTGDFQLRDTTGLFNVQYSYGWNSTETNQPFSIDLKGGFLTKNNNHLWDAVQELQTQQNRGYTNYTAIGTPSYSSGVYSDFGMYDYLVLPQELKSDDRTYIVKFTTGSDITTRQFVLNAEKLFDIEVYQGNICTTDWSGGVGSRTVLFSATANTAYYFKVVVDGTQKTFSHSTDGSTWTQDDQFTDTGLVPGRTVEDFTVGRGAWLSYPFLGSIDFNEFFVLKNYTQTVLWSPSTKAEEVVTDYTTSGSITVTDYIASGFSTSSWVYKDISQSSVTDFEFIIKVKQSSYASHSDVVNSRTADKPVGFDSSGHLGIYNGSDWQYGSTVYSTGVDTWVMLKYSEGSYKVYGLVDNDYTIDSLPALSSWNLETTWTTSLSTYLDSYLDLGANRTATQEYFRGTVDLTGTCVRINGTEVWRAVSFVSSYNYGNVSISKGYYNDGSHTILMPTQTLDLPELKYGQIIGNRNKVYAASYNGTASVHLVGDDATSQTLRGTYDVSVDVEQPVYLSHAENYAVSGDAGDISQVEFSYNPGGVSEDYTVVGSPTIDENFVASGFSSSNYLVSPDAFSPGDSSWEITVKIKTGSSIITDSVVFRHPTDSRGILLTFWNSHFAFTCSNGSSWIIPQGYGGMEGSYTVQTNTDYWVKIGFSGSAYYLKYSTDGSTYTLDINQTTTTKIGGGYNIYVGGNGDVYFPGSIYLTSLEVTVGDSVWWRAAQNEPASVTIPKTFWYDTTGKNSYWYPEAVTVAIDTVSSEQTLGDVNSVFVTNELGQDVSGITFTNGTVQGNYVSSAKAPGQNVYLDHKTHAKILGVQGAPDEIVVEGGGGTPIPDYSVSGSPTIDSNYVASNLYGNSYVYKDFDISSPTEYEIVTKVIFDNVNTHSIFCRSGSKSPVAIDVYGRLEEWNGSSYTRGSTTYSMNQALWIKLRYSSGQNTVYGLVDNGYTISTLPPTSSWNQEFSISANPDFLSGRLIFGVNVDNSSEYLQGNLYLEDTYVSVDGSIIWRAVDFSDPTEVTIGTTDNWTALQNRTYWYEEGNTTDVSDLTTDTYEADLKGYIIFTEDLNQDPVVKALTSAYEVTAYNTPEVYSGYSYTVTDSAGTTLDTFEKTGTFCKGFKHPEIAGTNFVFIPVEDLEDGKTYEAGDIRDYYSETNGTPFRQLDESSEDYTYDAATDTLTSENDVTFESIGYVYVEWDDIAE